MKLALRAVLALVIAASLWLLVVALIGALYRPNLQIPPGMLGKHVNVQMLSIRVFQRGGERRDDGPAPDVLLIHASPGSIEDWTPLFGALASSCRVTAYDRPGHGYSADWGAHSLRANAQLAQSLIERLRLQNVIVVGHAYGGAIALALALRRPQQVRAYVTLDTAAYEPARAPGPLFELLAVPLVGLGSASLLSPLLATRKIDSSLTHVFGPRRPPAGFVARRTRIWSTPKVAHATAREALGARAELATQSARYPEIDRPLVSLARHADPVRSQSAKRLAREVKGAGVRLLDHSGHYLQFDATREVARTVRDVAAKAQ